MISNMIKRTKASFNMKNALKAKLQRSYTKEELMSNFSRTRLFLQPLTFVGETSAVSVNPVKAKYGFKKDYITVTRNGYVYLEFMPTETNSNNRKKKAFMLNLERVGSILALPNEIDKGFHLDLSYITEDPKTGGKETKEMVIKKAKGEQNTTLMFETETEMDNSRYELQISYGEMLVLQRLLDYSLPFILGWHALESRKIAEEDLIED